MTEDPNALLIKVDVTPKGIRTFVLDLDEYEVNETGTKEKEVAGRKVPVAYMKFKIIEKKKK